MFACCLGFRSNEDGQWKEEQTDNAGGGGAGVVISDLCCAQLRRRVAVLIKSNGNNADPYCLCPLFLPAVNMCVQSLLGYTVLKALSGFGSGGTI